MTCPVLMLVMPACLRLLPSAKETPVAVDSLPAGTASAIAQVCASHSPSGERSKAERVSGALVATAMSSGKGSRTRCWPSTADASQTAQHIAPATTAKRFGFDEYLNVGITAPWFRNCILCPDARCHQKRKLNN